MDASGNQRTAGVETGQNVVVLYVDDFVPLGVGWSFPLFIHVTATTRNAKTQRRSYQYSYEPTTLSGADNHRIHALILVCANLYSILAQGCEGRHGGGGGLVWFLGSGPCSCSSLISRHANFGVRDWQTDIKIRKHPVVSGPTRLLDGDEITTQFDLRLAIRTSIRTSRLVTS